MAKKKPSKKANSKIMLIILLVIVGIVLLPVFAIVGFIYSIIKFSKSRQKRYLGLLAVSVLLFPIGVAAWTGGLGKSKQPVQQTIQTSKTSDSSKQKIEFSPSKPKTSTPVQLKQTKVQQTSTNAILQKLIQLTNAKNPGDNKNYYWENGKARLSGFANLKAGQYSFTSDNQGRTSTARAVLTYSEYKASQGARQGEPLKPPAWPANNPKVAISYSLTGRTYHGYLYNRSHSIADSLLGKGSYTSAYNFTTGTRPQNVGADQKGGMRAAEELAENYWKEHANSGNTIDYQTTPLYNGNETMPRGSIVDEESSDGSLNIEIIVINDAEGITLNYNSGESTAVSASPKANAAPAKSSSAAPATSTNWTTANGWSNAASGMVFLNNKSNK